MVAVLGLTLGSLCLVSPVEGLAGPTFKSAATNSHIGVAYLDVARPASTVSGDVLYAFVTVNQTTGGVITPPPGWTRDCWQAHGAAPAIVLALFTRAAGPAEPASYTFSFPANSGATIGIAAYAGADPVTPVEGCRGATATNTSAVGAPSITTSTPSSAVVGAFAFRGSGSSTPPTGTAERFDAKTASDATRSVSASAVDQLAASAGSVPAVTASSSLTSGAVVGLRFAIKPRPGSTLFTDSFNRPDGLITNEFAYFNPSHPSRIESPDWVVTSGSLFCFNGRAWTGKPDRISPDPTSSNGTNSAVFRALTRRSDFENVRVSFTLWNWGLLNVAMTDWDGVHVFLRYQNEAYLYYASVNRRDNTVVIKKKVPGGPSNDGTYYDISPVVVRSVPYGQPQQVQATVQTLANGSVKIALSVNGVLIVEGLDDGTKGGAVIAAKGAVGIRGDNANVEFDDFSVAHLG